MSNTTDILKRLRALPMTQAEIARQTGIPQPRICRWEQGNVPVGADDALRLKGLLDERALATEPQPAQLAPCPLPTPADVVQPAQAVA